MTPHPVLLITTAAWATTSTVTEKVLVARSRRDLLVKACIYGLGALLVLGGYFVLTWNDITGETGQVYNDRLISEFGREASAFEALPASERAAAEASLDAFEAAFVRALMSFGLALYGIAYALMGLDALRLAYGDLYYRADWRPAATLLRLRVLELGFTFIFMLVLPLILINAGRRNLGAEAAPGFIVTALGAAGVGVGMVIFRFYRVRQAQADLIEERTSNGTRRKSTG